MLRVNRPPSPSEKRMAELCALRRPLTDWEIDEVRELRITIQKAVARRRRYASNPEFRQREIERCTRTWRRKRA